MVLDGMPLMRAIVGEEVPTDVQTESNVDKVDGPQVVEEPVVDNTGDNREGTVVEDVPPEGNAVKRAGGFQIPPHLKERAEKATADFLQAFANIQNMDRENPDQRREEVEKSNAQRKKLSPKKRKRDVERKKVHGEVTSSVKKSVPEKIKEKTVEVTVQNNEGGNRTGKQRSKKRKEIAEDESVKIRETAKKGKQ